MTASDEQVTRPGSQGIPWRRLSGHFAEMVAAMVVGMAVLGMAARLALTLLGQADLLDGLQARVVVMVVTMGAGMTVWMRYRRHRWAGIVEMNSAMLLSFVVLLVPFWAGVLPASVVIGGGHVLMLPAMALVLLRRRAEFASGRRTTASVSTRSTRSFRDAAELTTDPGRERRAPGLAADSRIHPVPEES